MNHIGGMKREREDDDEVKCRPLAKAKKPAISQHSSMSQPSPSSRVTPVRKKEDFNLEVMVLEQARRRRAG